MTSNPSSAPLENFSSHGARDERFTVGVDLGQSHDPTAVAVVRRIDNDDWRPLFQVGHLERLPLNTPYPGVVRHVAQMLAAPRLRGKSELVIDFTGVGRPVFDMFVGHGVTPIGVTITAGDAVSRDGLISKVPKLNLISRIQALLHDGRLKIHKNLPDAPQLVAELQDFRGTVTDTGYWKFGARSGRHDDLVLAVAIALWRSHGDNISNFGLFEAVRREANGYITAPAPDFGFGLMAGESSLVRLRCKNNEGVVFGGFSGLRYLARGGVIEVQEADAPGLINIGFERVM